MPRGRGGFSGNRSSYGSGSNSRSNSGSRQNNQSYQSQRPQQPTQSRPQTTAPMQSGGGMMSGLGGMVMTGMAFGGGSAIGHSVVKSMMGGGESKENLPQQNNQQPQQIQEVENSNVNQNTQQKPHPCQEFNMKFVDCLKFNDNNIANCQSYFDQMKSCEKSLI